MILHASNYHSQEANLHYLSVSQYKAFVGTLGRPGCEARALAELRGTWEREVTDALLVGSYVDAHFEGTLGIFKAKNPEIFKKNGSLRAVYLRANEVIKRVERDNYMVQCLSGKTQVVMTAEIFGFMWKIKIDSYHAGRAIVDLKVMKDLTEFFWVKDHGKVTWIEYWGYDIQGAIYQEVVFKNTGERLPFVIAGVSKEKYPDIEVIGFDQPRFNDVIREIESSLQRIVDLKAGKETPTRCGSCDYCRHTKVLTRPIHYSEIQETV